MTPPVWPETLALLSDEWRDTHVLARLAGTDRVTMAHRLGRLKRAGLAEVRQARGRVMKLGEWRLRP
jgi:hypothetical protein